MDCDKIKDMLFLFIEGKLGEDEKIKVEKHLSECKRCSLEYNLIISIEQTLKKAKKEKAPDYLKKMILSEVFSGYNCKREIIQLGFLLSAGTLVSIIAALTYIPFEKIISTINGLVSKIQSFSSESISNILPQIVETIKLALSKFSYQDGLIVIFIILSIVIFLVEFVLSRIDQADI